MEVFEYRRTALIGMAALFLLVAGCFDFLPLPWNAVIIMATAIPSVLLVYKGLKKIRVEVKPDSILIHEGRRMRYLIQATEVKEITYRITETLSADAGLLVSRELAFVLKNGEKARLRVESMFKTQYLIMDALVARVETWCKKFHIEFTRIMIPVSMEMKAEEQAKKLRKYTAPPSGDLHDWQRSMARLLLFTIAGFVGGVACFMPSLGGVTPMTSVFALIGLCVLIIASCGLFKAMDKGLNQKPLKRENTRAGKMSIDS